jgi:hypothetical protein
MIFLAGRRAMPSAPARDVNATAIRNVRLGYR